MKKIFALAFLSLTIIGCNDDIEPLDEGFDINPGTRFEAEVDGVEFSASLSQAIISNGQTEIFGIIESTGEEISLFIDGNVSGTYVFNAQTPVNEAAYSPSANEVDFLAGPSGGSGTMTIDFDMTNNVVSGNFNFIGVKIVLDANGNPILDANGNPVTEVVQIENGVFLAIPLTSDDNTGGGNDFLEAVIDGQSFDATDIQAQLNPAIGGLPETISIVGTAGGQSITIIVEANITTGTFDILGGTSIPSGTYSASATNINIGVGTIDITLHDTANRIIEGDFDFDASPVGATTPVIVVTNGSFSASY
ncbi:MAG: DUF6252 family protein [Flavobacteriaceae bacterium]|nr:DUF6252 family protein [Flavobacteriaceae bacterium]